MRMYNFGRNDQRKFVSGANSFLYVSAQTAGAYFGVALANLMCEMPVIFASTEIRDGGSQFLSEFIATFELIGVIGTGAKFRPLAGSGFSRLLYYGGCLVHEFDFVRKSGGYFGAFRLEHFLEHLGGHHFVECSAVHYRAKARRFDGDDLFREAFKGSERKCLKRKEG